MIKTWHAAVGALALLALLGLVAMPAPPADVATAPEQRVQALPLPTVPPAVAARPVLAGPVAAVAPVAPSELDGQVAQARRGDRRAGHAAYQALSACVAPEAERPAFCRGLPASLVQERLRFLADAAQAGIAAAQIDFYMQGPDAAQAVDADALQAWRTEALNGLKDAAAQCEPLAMGLLATLHDSGELAPRDATLAVAYAVAEARTRHRPTSDERLRDRLAEPITDAELAAARAQGERLAASCR
ncbi:hypothetical protein ACS5PN_10450 [Roseateles sp. NT4]|uniref:hypothetical protein n=1 Tax=Roseateles sp. NT4 TaxID=3453715 RepID=UPI003EE9AAAD